MSLLNKTTSFFVVCCKTQPDTQVQTQSVQSLKLDVLHEPQPPPFNSLFIYKYHSKSVASQHNMINLILKCNSVCSLVA